MDLNHPIGDLSFAAIDFESAGAARGKTDVPVQIGIASWSPASGHGESFVSYLRSDRPITWAARKVHGIRDEDLAEAPSLLDLWPVIRHHLGTSVVVAHGKGTEKRFLRAFPGNRFGPWVDSLLLARAAWPTLPSHSLSDLCKHRQLTPLVQKLVPDRQWHDALFDAAASMLLVEDLIHTLKLSDQPLALLTQPDTSLYHKHRR